MSLAALQLADAGDNFAILVWVVIVLGPALVKILKKVASAASSLPSGGTDPSRARPERSARPRAETDAPDLSDGAERWRRLLAGEEEPEPAAPPPPAPPEPVVPSAERTRRPLSGRAGRARHSVMPMPDEGTVEPPADSAYAVATDAYALAGASEARDEGAAVRDATEGSAETPGARAAARVPAPLGFDRRSLRAGILWSELLAPPLALRGPEVPGGPAGPGGEAHL